MKKQNLASLAVGSAFAAAALTPMAHAASDNPFGARLLDDLRRQGIVLGSCSTELSTGDAAPSRYLSAGEFSSASDTLPSSLSARSSKRTLVMR
jgi:hypothetical protein